MAKVYKFCIYRKMRQLNKEVKAIQDGSYNTRKTDFNMERAFVHKGSGDALSDLLVLVRGRAEDMLKQLPTACILPFKRPS